MADKKSRAYLSTEDWLKRFKIAFAVAIVLIFIVLVIAFTLYRVELEQSLSLSSIVTGGTASSSLKGGAL